MITWIIVADASSGRIFKTTGKIENMALIEEFDHPESRNKGTDLITDRPGSAQQAGIHGGLPPKTEPKKVEADHFAIEIAQHINKKHGENAFAKLVIVAPPHFLGLLRNHLNSNVKKLISQIVHKDFSQLKEHQLKDSLHKNIQKAMAQ